MCACLYVDMFVLLMTSDMIQYCESCGYIEPSMALGWDCAMLVQVKVVCAQAGRRKALRHQLGS